MVARGPLLVPLFEGREKSVSCERSVNVARLRRMPIFWGGFDHGNKHDLVFFGTFHALEAARRQC